uniref:Uncharacterized protein n=1 Tax=Rhizophora mucronata TaxID=61149 RepID=A0A2P2NUW7_RHIMU
MQTLTATNIPCSSMVKFNQRGKKGIDMKSSGKVRGLPLSLCWLIYGIRYAIHQEYKIKTACIHCNTLSREFYNLF